MSIAIKVENLSKQYRLGEVGTGTISHDLNRWWHRIRGKEDPYLKIGETNDRTRKGSSEYVWAIKDISFDVQQGEVLGIIGRNGAGKSTLLKILSKVTAPTTGSIKAKGRIASLLEVGTGFHPELTGRENIYLNGTILGMTKVEVKTKLDEIVDFAGVERYLDTPVKRYSSGMMVRLGFAVAAHLEPEILIVDEVLAVGDAEFQNKAIGKMQEVSQGQGRTVLFVSHNMGIISKICDSAILLEYGKITFRGTPKMVVNSYLEHTKEELKSVITFNDSNFKKIAITNVKQEQSARFSFFDAVKVACEIKLKDAMPNATMKLGIAVLDRYGNKIFTTIYDKSIIGSAQQTVSMTIPPGVLLPGFYKLDIALFTPKIATYEYCSEILDFEIIESGSPFSLYENDNIGNVYINCQWEQHS